MDNPILTPSKPIFLANRWLIAIVALLLGAAVSLTWANYTSTKTAPSAKTATTSAKPAITGIVIGKSVDAAGVVTGKSVTFSKTDKSIVAVAYLKNVTRTDRVEMTRYFNGYLVESKSLVLKPTTNLYVAVTWTVSGTSTHKPGNYLVKFYLNGNLEQAKQYIVQ